MKRLLLLSFICLAVFSCNKEDDNDHNNSTSSIKGCTDSIALNYNPNAIFDNGSCVYFPNIDWSLYPYDLNNYSNLYNFIDLESNWSPNLNTVRKILLENYTGHKCTNCPDAAIIAEDLENDTSLGVVVVSIHASADGSFQETDGTYTTDFTTPAGDVYVVNMPGMFANPLGTINRKSNGLNGSVWHLANSWETAINQETNQNLLANIQIQTNYFPSTNGLFIHTQTEFNSDLVGEYNLIIYLLRKSVVSPQAMNNGTINFNYNHRNVLSDNINGAWGTQLVFGSVSSGEKFYNHFSYQLISPSTNITYDLSNLCLVTFVCEKNTFEVIQVIRNDL